MKNLPLCMGVFSRLRFLAGNKLAFRCAPKRELDKWPKVLSHLRIRSEKFASVS
jgi:hypothetical protein